MRPTLLASIIAGEASPKKGIAGQQAVLNVIQNRAATNFGSHGTTWIAQATAPLQFSAYPNALGTPTDETYALIAAAIDGQLGNIVPKSLNYANIALATASWVKIAAATGLGVDIAGNTFWENDQGGSPGYDPTKIWSPGLLPVSPPDVATAIITQMALQLKAVLSSNGIT